MSPDPWETRCGNGTVVMKEKSQDFKAWTVCPVRTKYYITSRKVVSCFLCRNEERGGQGLSEVWWVQAGGGMGTIPPFSAQPPPGPQRPRWDSPDETHMKEEARAEQEMGFLLGVESMVLPTLNMRN